MKKKSAIILLTLFMISGPAAVCLGSGFRSLGYQAISMGGAGVACSNGSYAAYFNPALLTAHKHFVEVNISAGVGFREDNVADHIDTLSKIGIEDTFNQLSNLDFSDIGNIDPGSTINAASVLGESVRSDIRTIQNELTAMSAGNGLELTPSAAVAVQAKNFSVGVYGFSDVAATAVIDRQRMDIIFPVDQGGTRYYVEYDPTGDAFTLSDQGDYESRSLDYAVKQQTTTIMISGAVYAEIPIAYAWRFKTAWGDLSVGGAFKFMTGNTYKLDKPIDTKSGDVSDDLDDYKKENTTYGIDAGLLLNPAGMKNLSLGLVVKNINTPKFDYIDGSKLEIKPQVRVGVAYNALMDRLTLALDMDLTNNDGLLPNYQEQYIGGGLDFHPFSWLSLRAGLMQNIQESDEGTVLTAGFGIGAKWFQLDLAGQYSTKSGSYDGNDIPRYGRIQASIVSKWF